MTNMATAPTMAAARHQQQAVAGQVEADEDAHDAGDEHDGGAPRPALDGVARRLAEPAAGGHRLLQPVVEAAHALGEVGHVLGLDGADGAAQALQLVERVLLGLTEGLAAVACQPRRRAGRAP